MGLVANAVEAGAQDVQVSLNLGRFAFSVSDNGVAQLLLRAVGCGSLAVTLSGFGAQAQAWTRRTCNCLAPRMSLRRRQILGWCYRKTTCWLVSPLDLGCAGPYSIAASSSVRSSTWRLWTFPPCLVRLSTPLPSRFPSRNQTIPASRPTVAVLAAARLSAKCGWMACPCRVHPPASLARPAR